MARAVFSVGARHAVPDGSVAEIVRPAQLAAASAPAKKKPLRDSASTV